MLDTLNGHPVQQAYKNITPILYFFQVWHPVIFLFIFNFNYQLRGMVLFFLYLIIKYVNLISNDEIYLNIYLRNPYKQGRKLCRGMVTWSRFKRIASTRLGKNLIKALWFYPNSLQISTFYILSSPIENDVFSFILPSAPITDDFCMTKRWQVAR